MNMAIYFSSSRCVFTVRCSERPCIDFKHRPLWGGSYRAVLPSGAYKKIRHMLNETHVNTPLVTRPRTDYRVQSIYCKEQSPCHCPCSHFTLRRTINQCTTNVSPKNSETLIQWTLHCLLWWFHKPALTMIWAQWFHCRALFTETTRLLDTVNPFTLEMHTSRNRLPIFE